MTKTTAALRHFWPSILLLAIIISLIVLVWYPYPFLHFKTNNQLSLSLVIAGALIGPALTWILYRPGKWGLVFDLIVVVLIQLAAISWGTFALYQNRPFFMVFTVSHFEVLSEREVDYSEIKRPEFLDKPAFGPVLLYANMPKEPEHFQKLLKEVMFEGKPDLQFRPEFWSLYSERQQQALAVSQPLKSLLDAHPDSASEISKLVKLLDKDISALRFLPGLVQDEAFATILDADSGVVLDTLSIDAFKDQSEP